MNRSWAVPADRAGPRTPLAGRGADAGRDATERIAEIFQAHHLELVRLAMLMMGSLDAAEDVVQDCFERLHRSWPRLREPENALGYIRSSVLNGCRSAHRRIAVARKHAPRIAERAEAPGPDLADAVGYRTDLLEALWKLPRRQREVLVLRYYLDLDVAEIAAALDIGASAVRSTASRGLEALALKLRGEDR